jgi:glutathione S-transferase
VHPGAVITFHTIPGNFGLESVSPFCMKVELYLKLTKLAYKADKGGDPRKTPKGKLPHLVDEDGTAICDSSAIIEYLEKKHGEPLDKGLDEMQRARGHVIKRTLEESTYFTMLWSRWSEDAGWEVVKHFFDAIPMPLRLFVPGIIRKKIVESTKAQGIGRHTRDEIYRWGKADLQSVATLIGDGPYVLGERFSTYDLTAYAFVANVLKFELDSPMRDFVKSDARLLSYVERVAKRVADAGSETKAAAE